MSFTTIGIQSQANTKQPRALRWLCFLLCPQGKGPMPGNVQTQDAQKGASSCHEAPNSVFPLDHHNLSADPSCLCLGVSIRCLVILLK